jgi:hypothetical protein
MASPPIVQVHFNASSIPQNHFGKSAPTRRFQPERCCHPLEIA